MSKLWFRCISCDKLKLPSKKTYKVIAQGEGYTKELQMCASCGDSLNYLADEAEKRFGVDDE